jgi:hypothetical protein
VSRASTIRGLAASAVVFLLLVAMSAAGQAQQASDSGQGSAPAAVAAGDQAPRTYIPSLFGQQPIAVDMWQPAVSSHEAAPAVGVIDTASQDSGTVEPWAPYVRNPARHYLLYGLNLSASYEHDTAYQGFPAASRVLPQFAPYLGLMGHTRTGYFVLQYAPSIVPYDSALGRAVTFHNLGFDAGGAFTRRLSWKFDAHAGYGGEVGRLTGDLNSQAVVAGVSESGPSFASLQPLTGNALNSSTSAGLGYQLSPRESIHAAISDTYNGFVYAPAATLPAGSVSNVRDNTVGLALSFDRTISPTMTLHAYGNSDRIFSNVLPCHSFGGGLGMTYQPTRTVTADVGAGPSSGCGAQAANFHANLAAALRNRVRVYGGASRQMNTTYRLNSRWEDNVAGGAAKQFGHADLGFDAGYFHGQPLGLVGPSSGYFVSPRINYSLRLSRVSGIGFSYRRFQGSSNSGPGLSFAMVTLMFSPAPLPLEK